MKCALCHTRKGTRRCKVTSAQVICPSCCASIRRNECVGCDFYETSLAFHIELDPDYEPAIINRIAVDRLKDGEAMLDVALREVDYYAEFKVPGRSYVQELAKRPESTEKHLSSHAQSEE
jgi:hypothetical protein